MSISAGVVRALEQRPMTAGELADHMSLPVPHIRAAVSELVFIDRKITCDGEGTFCLGTPPQSWPKAKRPK